MIGMESQSHKQNTPTPARGNCQLLVLTLSAEIEIVAYVQVRVIANSIVLCLHGKWLFPFTFAYA